MTKDPVVETTGFDQFVQQRTERLWRAAWLLTGDRHHAEDLLQTALVKTFARYEQMRDDDHYEAYVRKTIHRTFISWWRRSSWRSEFPSGEPRGRPEGDAAQLDLELRVDVARAIAKLPRMQRSVMVLRYFDDMTAPQVAEALGITEGTVRSHSNRARQALRDLLKLPDEEAVS